MFDKTNIGIEGSKDMFSQISERLMHRVRWVLTSLWLLLIGSLLIDPLTPWLTDSKQSWSPFYIDPTICVKVQGKCLFEQPYSLAPTIFWGAIVPSAIFILLICGHELWRRICPLSFLSQIPRALGKQRQIRRTNPKTGVVRHELAKVKPASWLGRNYQWVQFGWLYVGLCARILFINSDRTSLFIWFAVTIIAAIAVGYFYGGKAWCQYFCPMAPVQQIYAEPGGLFASKAQVGDRQITQSMCRTVEADGTERSACVACQNPCIDIDAERAYWDGVTQPYQRWLYYGYIGLVVGYFSYYYLYAGNWDYYFSGAWARQPNQLTTLLDPGFYIFKNPIPIAKIVAVPLTLGLFSYAGYAIGCFIEKQYRAYLDRRKQPVSNEIFQHRLFTVGTFLVFNFFFIFGGRPLILLLPFPLQFLYEAVLTGLSTLWLYRTWHRSPERYDRENLATRLRRQLVKLQINVEQYLSGRSLADLSSDEVYVLAKIIPEFTREKRHAAYKGVLREALEEGYVDTASSLEVLQQIRSELEIGEPEHRQVLEELGVEDPQLLDPQQRRSKENLVRLNGYRKALERMMGLRERQAGAAQTSSTELRQREQHELRALRRDYAITLQEETATIEDLDPERLTLRRAELLLEQLHNSIDRYQALSQPILAVDLPTVTVIRSIVKQHKRLLAIGLLEILAALASAEAAFQIATDDLGQLSSHALQELLADKSRWNLSANILAQLTAVPDAPPSNVEVSPAAIATHLESMLSEPNPLLQAASLYLLHRLDPARAQAQVQFWQDSQRKLSPLMQEMAQQIRKPNATALIDFPTLEKLVYLSDSDFFDGVYSETLIELANRSSVKVYTAGDLITEQGDTCRELLLSIEGTAEIHYQQLDRSIHVVAILPGRVLDELEVLSHSTLTNTIVATGTPTRILALPVDSFDDMFDRDSDFARRVLELESRHLQQLVRQNVDKI
jgi:Cyclic nucleotide-binding domain/4Fe-4S binding domain